MKGIPLYIYTIIIPTPALSFTRLTNSLESLIKFRLYNILDIIPVLEKIANASITTIICGTIIGKFNKKYLNLENLLFVIKYASKTPIIVAINDDIIDVFKLKTNEVVNC